MTTPIRTTDFISKLTLAASTAVKQADANRSGVLTAAEERTLPAHLKDDVAAYRTAKKSVRVSGFLSSFEAGVRSAATAADVDRDGSLSAAEFARLPAALKDSVDALWATAPQTPGPVAPQPAPTTPAPSAAFGISGVVPAARVDVKTVLDRGLATPTALAFHPTDGSLWVVNHGNDSTVIIDAPGQAGQRAQRFVDDSAHFMHRPTAIAFSAGRNEFATVQDTDNDYGVHQHGNMFMGPTVFTADRRLFEGGTQSHLDMLHHSPMPMGIAAGADSVRREYWVFNGQSGSIDRYFFNEPHELGGHDHSDGLTVRYAAGALAREGAAVPSHLAFDAATGALYIADTGNGRIAKLDTKLSIRGAQRVPAHHAETPLFQVPGSAVTTVAEGQGKPSGLLLVNGDLVVGDYATGRVRVLGTDGAVKGEVDTGVGPGALTGLAAGRDGRLYFLDGKRGRVLSLAVRPAN